VPNAPTAAPLRRLRLSMGWRATEIAAAAHVTLGTVAKLESLNSKVLAGVKLGTLVRVSQAVGVAPSELIPGLGSRPARRSPMLPGPPLEDTTQVVGAAADKSPG